MLASISRQRGVVGVRRTQQRLSLSPPHPNPCMGLSLSSTKLPHAPLSFRAFCDGGGNATLGVPAKRKRALLRSNLPRNSRPETNCDATGAGEQPLVGVCFDHLNFASSCWHH